MIPGVEIPELEKAKKILTVQPHYDDNDIGAGGTLHHLNQAGAEIVYLTVTDDLAGIIPHKGEGSLVKTEAISKLQENQEAAANLIGVHKQIRLGFPDAGQYDYFLLREQIVDHIRQEKPDFLFTVDPWTPYEAHNDHIMTGKVCAEAAILYDLPAGGEYIPKEMNGYKLRGVVFYNTAFPNLLFDSVESIATKQKTAKAYTAQFPEDDLDLLIQQTRFLADYIAREKPFYCAEALKVLAPWMLHGVQMTKML